MTTLFAPKGMHAPAGNKNLCTRGLNTPWANLFVAVMMAVFVLVPKWGFAQSVEKYAAANDSELILNGDWDDPRPEGDGPTRDATTYFTDGFEDGVFYNWSEDNTSSSTGQSDDRAHSGDYSYKFATYSGGIQRLFSTKQDDSNEGGVDVSFYFYLDNANLSYFVAGYSTNGSNFSAFTTSTEDAGSGWTKCSMSTDVSGVKYITIQVQVTSGSVYIDDVSMLGKSATPSTPTYNMPTGTSNSKSVDCSTGLLFYDSGGSSGNYGNKETRQVTFTPNTSGRMLKIHFNSFDTESNYDKIYIYNGSSTSDPVLVNGVSGTTAPSDVQATNCDGALTVRFTSDDSQFSAGWEALITCESPSTITSKLTYSVNSGSGSISVKRCGSSVSSNTNVVRGVTLDITATPSTGYNFSSWTVSGTNASVLNTSSSSTILTMGTANTTLKANFTAKTYTVTLNNQSATSAGSTSVTATYGSAMPSITCPTRTGYTFGGYYTGTSGSGTQYYNSSGSSVKNWDIDSPTTLYAKWTANTNTAYKVYHYTKNVGASTYTQNGDVDNLTGTTGVSLTLSNLKRTITGFTYSEGFAGTAATGTTKPTSGAVTTTTILADGTRVISLYYSRDSYNVNLTAGTGISSTSGGGSKEYGANVSIDATVMNGYTWSKWQQTSGGTQVSTTKNYSFTMPSSAQSYTAVATLNTYTITYDLDGGSHGSTHPDSYNVTSSNITLSNPTKTGYTFAGWTVTTAPTAWGSGSSSSGATDFIIATGTYGNIELKATWTINSHTLTINYKYSNNTQAATTYSQSYNYGASYSVASPSITGYTPSQATVSGTMPDSDVTVDVIYTINSYTITAKSNSTYGRVSINNSGTWSALETASVEHGNSCTIHAQANSGYKFSKWTENNSSGSDVSTNEDYTIASVTAEATYYANFVQTHALTLNATNGSIAASYEWNGNTVNVSSGDQVPDGVEVSIEATANANYEFVRWSRTTGNGTFANGSNTSTTNPTTFTMGTNDCTISAEFELSGVTITATANNGSYGTVLATTSTGTSGTEGSTSTATVNVGGSCTLTATPALGYSFTNWTKSGFSSTDNPLNLTGITEAATYTANFTAITTWTTAETLNPGTDHYETDGSGNVTIKSARGLAWLVSVVNGLNGQGGSTLSGKTVTLTADVDMDAHVWVPITGFAGTFDGGGHSISNLHISNASEATAAGNPANIGLFGSTASGATIKNLYVVEANFFGNTGNIGGIVGTNGEGSTVQNCFSSATLSGSATYKGGLVGANSGTLSHSYTMFTDGVYGNNSGTVTHCYNKAANDETPGTGFTAPNYTYGNYHKNNTATVGGVTKPLVEWLNTENSTGQWMLPKGATRINGGYPVLMPASGGSKTGEALAVASKAGSKSLSYGTAAALIAKYNTGGTDAATEEHPADIYVYDSGDLGNTAPDNANLHLFIDEDVAVTQNSIAADITATVGITLKNPHGYGEENRDWHCFATPLKAVPLGIRYTNTDPVPYEAPNSTVHGYMSFNGGYFPSSLGLEKTEFDFYAFCEPDYHWLNLKRAPNSHWHSDVNSNGEHANISYTTDGNLKSGNGYLLAIGDNTGTDANKETYLSATGVLNRSDNLQIPITASGGHLSGYNFLGNPYQSYLDFSKFVEENTDIWGEGSLGYNAYLVYDANEGRFNEFLLSGDEGFSQNAATTATQYIHPHQGFFIVKSGTADNAVFKNSMRVTNSAPFRDEVRPTYPLVNLICTDDNGKREVSIIEVERPSMAGALKMKDMLNGKANMYIHWGEEDFSSMFLTNTPEFVPVWFKVAEEGVFTMSWSTANDNFGYLHLVDNLTGADIDCLATDSYTFQGKPGDMKARFRLVFSALGIEEETETEQGENFAFIVGNELVVTGEGELSLIDLNGRVLTTEHVSGQQSHITMPKVAVGMYMLRLTNGSGVKVQKIVVRK